MSGRDLPGERSGGRDDGQAGPVRVVLRPMGSPLPLGFLGLAMATTAFAVVELRLVSAAQAHIAALAVLLFTAPLQFLVSVLAFLARDPVAGAAMGILSGTWAVVGAVTLTSAPGTSAPGTSAPGTSAPGTSAPGTADPALGVVLLTAAAAMLVPALAGLPKLLAAVVMTISATRFALTGVYELTASPEWRTAAGVAGLVLAAAAYYAALAFELEDTHGRALLPVARLGRARTALRGDLGDQTKGLAREAGVRDQL
ncbi:GPR1/FUN34/YaaH family transporter [Microbispora hainanensis]|uniref:GPR1/FUN34/YaaH family transporter n=1 Tax=Microbispora hainanensis TaxID=568844 RepID=UPI002E2A5902|nr:GPR1/FUN34/YaaH family transporter [Microbispora hainanensis]